jgi:hypothetical protein
MTEEEFRTGKKDDGSPINEPEFDYVSEAAQTLSLSFHGDKVGLGILSKSVDEAITALQKLDHIKKALFYGRDAHLEQKDQADSTAAIKSIVATSDLEEQEAINMVHAILGMATEAGELLEMMRDSYNGLGVDRPNIIEEVGDSKWYMAILAPIGRFLWGQDEKINIAKLRARFPERFTEYDANNRDLAAERKLLEAGRNDLSKPIGQRKAKMPGELSQDGDAISKQT